MSRTEIIDSPAFQKVLQECSQERISSFQERIAKEKDSIRPTPNTTNLASYIDHTLLSPSATSSQIRTICEEACKYKFKAICVNPCHVAEARRVLKELGEGPLLAAVVGFPLGQNLTRTKVQESKEMLNDESMRIDEIDIVINVGWLVEGEFGRIVEELALVQQEAEKTGAIVKVIIESGLLRRDFGEDRIKEACACCIIAGIEFVKTSTGFLGTGASLVDVKLMHSMVGPFGMKVKASGGVGTKEDAVKMIEAGADRIGASKGVAIVQGGASTKGGY